MSKSYNKIDATEIDEFSAEVADKVKSEWELIGVFDKDSDPKEVEAILKKAASDVWENRNKNKETNKAEINEFSEEAADKVKNNWKLIGVMDKDSTPEEVEAIIREAAHLVWLNKDK